MKRDPAGLCVFALALSVRLLYAAVQGAPPAERVADAGEYHQYALSLVERGRYEGPGGSAARRMPGYPLFLAGVYAVAGSSPLAVVLAQCLLGAAACLLLRGAAEDALGPPWGLACGLAAAVYRGLVASCALLLSECLYAACMALALRLLFEKRRPPRRRAVLFCLAAGAAYLVRPEFLAAACASAALLPWILPGLRRRDLAAAVLALGLLPALWTLRNAAVLGRFVPATTAGPSVLLQSLYQSLAQQSGKADEPYQLPAGLEEAARDRACMEEYRRILLELGWRRRLKTRLYNLAAVYYPFLPGYDATFALLVPLWLAGLLAAARRPLWWPAAAAVLVSSAVYVFFGGPASRYRTGFSPALLLLAALGARRLGERFPPSRWRPWALAWTGGNLAVWAFSERARALGLCLKSLLWA